MEIFLVQFSFAIILFILINWIGKQSYSIGYLSMSLFVKADEAPAFNFVIRVLSPIVYIIIISTLLYQFRLDQFVNNIYLVCIYYVVIRLVFNLITNRGLLLNWTRQISYWIFIVGISYIVYQLLIKTKQNILPDFSTIANELWIIILIFLYSIINKIPQSAEGTIKRKRKYLEKRFTTFQTKYGSVVNKRIANEKLKGLVYAIMIFEDFNRPKMIRFIEYSWFYLTKRPLTMGVMQVRSNIYINELQSVQRGIDLVLNYYVDTLKQFENTEIKEYFERYSFLPALIAKYNGGLKYQNSILDLYDEIVQKFYPKTTDQLI
jgi:hypothetical protein